MATAKKNIVILGGSYGGISVAHNILKHTLPHLTNKESYQIVMISPATEAMCRPGCPRALISDDMFDQSRFFVSVPKQFEQYPKDSFRFIQGTAVGLDHKKRIVSYTVASNQKASSPEQLPFHSLIIATGSSTPSPLFSFNTDEKALRANWATFRTALPSAKTIVIAGAGPTGIEVAGELGEHLNGKPGYFGSKLSNPKVTITIVTAGSRILPVLRPSIANKAEGMLAKVGVTIMKNARVVSVSPEGSGTETNVATKTVVTLADGKTLEADIYIPAFGMRYNTSFVAKELLTSQGRIETNSNTLRVDRAGRRIYAVGDVASAARPAIHLLMEEIPVLCTNIKRDLLMDAQLSGKDRIFNEDTKETQLVPIGKGTGVGAGGGFAMPGFMVWAIKGRDYWLWTTGKLWNGKQWIDEK